MKRLRFLGGYSIIELLIVVSVIGILTSMVVIGLSNYRSTARDANRIKDMQTYQTAVEQYYTLRKTYLIFRETQTTCTVGNDCVGYHNQGWGRITRKNIATKYGSVSIAEVLRNIGFINEIKTDPRNNDYTSDNTDPVTFDDYILTVCNPGGGQALSVATATSFAIYGNIERPTDQDKQVARQYCGGPDTPAGWDTLK